MASSAPISSTLKEEDTFSLLAISPLDGRYSSSSSPLKKYFSEFALIQYRTFVEIEWICTLAEETDIREIPSLQKATVEFLKSLSTLTIEDAKTVKSLEKQTNHDVKAIEYYIKKRIDESGIHELQKIKEFVHFGCTSEDINNLSYSLLLHHSIRQVIRPKIIEMTKKVAEIADKYARVPLLARTHGQPATPTTFGKEMANTAARLRHHILNALDKISYFGKFNGAVGNFNAHQVAFPAVDWKLLSRKLVEERCGLTFQPYSTQSECHDFIAELCDSIARINSTLIDFSNDMWLYISRDILKLRVVDTEVGSSAMPHKVNPIDFENCEGNLGLSNALLKFFSGKLPISRLQRDLSDSTVMRNIGVSLTHAFIGYNALLKGLNKIEVNESQVQLELEMHWEVLAEPIQTVMRKCGIDSPYEKLKAFTRGHPIDKDQLKEFIACECNQMDKEDIDAIQQLTPHSYIGLAVQLTNECVNEIRALQ